jgi:alpha-beta hydrolase superfamily lysophospholipase
MEKGKRRFKLPVIVKWIFWVLLVQFILANISAALYAYKLTHVWDDPSLRVYHPPKNVFDKTWRLFSGPRQPRSIIEEYPTFPYDTITFKTKNNLAIEAWYSKADSTARGTVILFHGLAANKGMVISEAADFRYQGYNVLMVDLRAHGNSEGHTTTLGITEIEEVKLAYDHVQAKGEKNIFLWGASMGAVVITRALYKYELKPAGIILEMPFGSLQSHLQARARVIGFQGFPERPFGFFVSWWMGVERGFSGQKHRTTTYVKQITCPVLVQWGAKDQYVLKGEIGGVFAAIASKDKKMVIYENAGHESLLRNDPAKWRKEVEGFLNKTNPTF